MSFKEIYNDIAEYTSYGLVGRLLLVLLIIGLCFIPHFMGLTGFLNENVKDNIFAIAFASGAVTVFVGVILAVLLFITLLIVSVVGWVLTSNWISFESHLIWILEFIKPFVFTFNLLIGKSKGKTELLKHIRRFFRTKVEKAKDTLAE